MEEMRLSAQAVLTGWYVGYAIGAVIVSLVVVLVATILTLARKIGVQAQEAIVALDEARVNTLPLWEVNKASDGLRSITMTASRARAVLGGEG